MKLDPWKLAAKSVILTMLTTMCRLDEVASIQVPDIHRSVAGIRVTLKKLTKTFNNRNYAHAKGLQILDIAFSRHDPALCPVTSIQGYLDKTGPICGDIKALFIVLVGTIRPATKMTLNRWERSFMTEAGLGNFSVHSNRSTAATSGLMTGIPLDELISRVGWSHPSTFINHYLKPLHQFRHHFRTRGRNLPPAKQKFQSD